MWYNRFIQSGKNYRFSESSSSTAAAEAAAEVDATAITTAIKTIKNKPPSISQRICDSLACVVVVVVVVVAKVNN